MAAGELAEEDYGEDDRCDCGVEGDGVKTKGVGWDCDAPGESGGEAGVAAFGEVAESEEGPDEGGAGAPGVEGVEDGEMAKAERRVKRPAFQSLSEFKPTMAAVRRLRVRAAMSPTAARMPKVGSRRWPEWKR